MMKRISGAQPGPIISVITVVFNGCREIAKTMDSVLVQDYPHLEYIVVDGASTDGTQEVIRQYEARLDAFVSERDEGVYDAMNKALDLAAGEFVLFMNCGDVFASPDALSSAMRHVSSDEDQVVFGAWLRRGGEAPLVHCRPALTPSRFMFNHQSVLYSRHIHDWHGKYLNVRGLTTADYLFFVTLLESSRVVCKVIDTTLAIIDVNGISAGPQTYSQKYAIDFLCGRVGKWRLLLVLLLHSVYRRLKAWRRWFR